MKKNHCGRSFNVYHYVAEMMATKKMVKMNMQKATLMSNYDLTDHTELDMYVQIMTHEEWCIDDWIREVLMAQVQIRQKIVIMMIGCVDMLAGKPGKIANHL